MGCGPRSTTWCDSWLRHALHASWHRPPPTKLRNDAATYGHFGGAGTMMWTDPAADVSLVALTDRPFDQWSGDALRHWPELSDAVLDEFAMTESAS